MSENFDYDLIVIGGGSGGVRAARVCAASGMKVALCEADELGGTCVNRGCVPKKLIHYAAHFHHLHHLFPSFGLSTGSVSFDWATLRNNVQSYIRTLNDNYQKVLLANNVEIVRGFAQIHGNNSVLVNGKTISAKRVLLAVGGVPARLPVEGSEHAIVSDDIFHLDSLPRSMVVVGGGYIAVEIASIFHGLGVEITLVHRGARLLRQFDNYTTQHFSKALKQAGLELQLEANVTSISPSSNDHQLTLQLDNGATLSAEKVLFATGRTPNLTNLGLEKLPEFNPATFFDKHKIRVNKNYQSAIPWLYALGDITGIAPELTPVAIRQGMIFHSHLMDIPPPPLDPLLIPTAVFSLPTLAFVGMSEEAALQYGEKHRCLVSIWKSKFKPMDSGFAKMNLKNHYKFVTIGEEHQIVGVFLLGAGVDELLQPLTSLVEQKATISLLGRTLAIHPTFAEELLTPQVVYQKAF